MPVNIVFDQDFTGRDGDVYRLVVTADGSMYAVAANGTYSLLDTVAAGSRVSAVVAYGRLYTSFYNAQGGCDAPRQWDGKTIRRVARGGPGAVCSFTPTEISGDEYPIATITQPAAKNWGFAYFLQSQAVGDNSTAGTNVTIYYADETAGASADMDLVNSVASGFPVYMYVSFTGGPATQGPYVVQITSAPSTSVSPPDQPHKFFYFTYTVPTAALTYYQGSGHPGYTANYQRTLATITTSVPVPDVLIGDNVNIAGTSQASYNSTWPIQQTPTSASVSITQTQLVGGVATYNYVVQSGLPPSAGQQITVTGTFNAGGVLNVTNRTIATSTGGAVGSFTIDGFTAPDAPSAVESGAGVTEGTVFCIEPALLFLGTPTNPIFGASTGGFFVFAGSSAIISPGNRQGVVFFIDDLQSNTAPSPIGSFSVPANVNAIRVDGLPIGPAGTAARAVAFTGANGSKFFYLPVAPQVNGTVTGTSTVVNDNTSTSATFFFTDDALFRGLGIDIPGNNQFQQVTLDTPSGVAWYQNRLFWYGGRNKVTSLLNMEMDGGTLSGSSAPLGWATVGTGGGLSYIGTAPVYAVNGGTGKIQQGAYQTADGEPIVLPSQTYLFRLWNDGGGGTAVVTLSSASTDFSSTATIQLATRGYAQANFTLATPSIIPSDLVLSYELSAGAGAVRDLQLIYADNPFRNPVARASYVANPEAYDQETGNIGPADDSSELRAMFVLQESLHFLTADRLYYVIAVGNAEPSSWTPDQISDKCGAWLNAVTTGRGFAAWGGSLGAFRYTGGIPLKLSNVIDPTWRDFSDALAVQDDPDFQRIYFALVKGGTPTLLHADYHEMQDGGPIKWTPWNRQPNWITASTEGTRFVFGPKTYYLDAEDGATDDDLGDIGGYYTFSPFAGGQFRKDYSQLLLSIEGQGTLTPFVFKQKLSQLSQALAPQDLAKLIDIVAEWPVNQSGRVLYLKVGQPGCAYSLDGVTCVYGIDPNAPIAGAR